MKGYGAAAVLALLICFPCRGAGLVPEPLECAAPQYVNVQEYGAAGNALYHHPLGVRGGETDPAQYTGWYWAGHFSSLVTAQYHERYQGEDGGRFVDVYRVVPDTEEPSENRIPLSQVNPGPFYEPSVGDLVVQYEAADEEKSVYAADDSEAFERAIAQGSGALYLPEGDYLISQLTAAKISDITGPGRIWLKEWRGGVLWYLIMGWSELVEYKGYGWIDAEHFHNEAWRAMHWVTDLPKVNSWDSSADFKSDYDSPCVEYLFDETRENINVWLTAAPAVPREEFPDTLTLCIASDMASYYSLEGSAEWKRATSGSIEGGMFHSSWSGKSRALPPGSWKDCGGWIEVTIPKGYFFSPLEGADTDIWYFHCWNTENVSLSGQAVEFTKSYAKVWVKESTANRCLTCRIGGDMRSPHGNRPTTEYYIHEAYRGATRYLDFRPRKFYAYSVSDERFAEYFAV